MHQLLREFKKSSALIYRFGWLANRMFVRNGLFYYLFQLCTSNFQIFVTKRLSYTNLRNTCAINVCMYTFIFERLTSMNVH